VGRAVWISQGRDTGQDGVAAPQPRLRSTCISSQWERHHNCVILVTRSPGARRRRSSGCKRDLPLFPACTENNRLHWKQAPLERKQQRVCIPTTYLCITRNAVCAFDRLLTKRIGQAETQSATGGEELELESSNLTRRPESGEKAGLTVEHHTKTLSGNDHDLALLPCCRHLFVNLSISFQKANTVRIKSASSILDNLKCPPTETWDTARYRSLPRRPRARWTVDSLPQADTGVLPKKRTQVAKSQGVPHSAHPVTRTLAGARSPAHHRAPEFRPDVPRTP